MEKLVIEFKKELVKELDKLFPKHKCKERGRALVLFAWATVFCRRALEKQKSEILDMIKFDIEDLPVFPSPEMLKKLRKPDGLLEFALMIIKAKIKRIK